MEELRCDRLRKKERSEVKSRIIDWINGAREGLHCCNSILRGHRSEQSHGK